MVSREIKRSPLGRLIGLVAFSRVQSFRIHTFTHNMCRTSDPQAALSSGCIQTELGCPLRLGKAHFEDVRLEAHSVLQMSVGGRDALWHVDRGVRCSSPLSHSWTLEVSGAHIGIPRSHLCEPHARTGWPTDASCIAVQCHVTSCHVVHRNMRPLH